MLDKAAFAIFLILSIVIPPHPPAFLIGGVSVLLLALIAASRIPVLFFLKRLLFFEPFILTVAALALFQPGGFPKLVLLVAKSSLSLIAVILLSNTTSFQDLLRVLRRVHAPSVFVTMMALMCRHIFRPDRRNTTHAARPLQQDFRQGTRRDVGLPFAGRRPVVPAFDGASRAHLRGHVRPWMEMTAPAVEVKGLGFRYEDGHVALHDVTLAVEEGESVGLIGPNGAGKSTFLLHLNGILPEDARGEAALRIHGVPEVKANLPRIRRDVALLFQEPEDQLFCPSVFDDVAFGPRQFGIGNGAVEDIVRQALAKVGLQGFERRSPHHLSCGEKQRVCLAGLLACRPRVLALDEPTRGLDPRGKRLLKSLLRTIEATKIIAAHDLELVAELCTRAVVMDEEMIVADGPALSILADIDLMLKHGLEKPHILRHSHPH